MAQENVWLIVSPHPDDDAIGCGALLLSLSNLSEIHIAYAVSGFNGVTDRYVEKKHKISIKEKSEKKIRKIKDEIRKKEAQACCDFLGATAHFLRLPFYESNKNNSRHDPSILPLDTISTKSLGANGGSLKQFEKDITIAVKLLKKIKPNTIVLIDEENDPHGTHGIVRAIFRQAINKISFTGKILGYQVWDNNYSQKDCCKKIFFDEKTMIEKIKLINFYKSQVEDPAFPHKTHSFVDLVRKMNKKQAERFSAPHLYVECYKLLN
jgi:LmbE family N-acetylglucosaminyl deacetylase